MKRPDGCASSGVDRFLLGVGIYSISESNRVIRDKINREFQSIVDSKNYRIEPRLLKRWAHGRKESARDYAPLLRGAEKVGRYSVFTFLELIELLTIAAFRASGNSPATIRAAYERASQKYGDHPFARDFRTNGFGIFTSATDPEAEELSTRQIFMEEMLKRVLMDVSYANGKAVRFSPLGEDRNVVLDPDLALGSPSDKKTGVPTSALFAMKEFGESIDSISEWYNVTRESVSDAIEYEEALRQAA